MQSSLSVRIGKTQRLLLTLILCIISIGVTGYRGEYGHNHPLQLVAVERILNPQSYPNDPLADTSVAYASLFWYLVAYASKVLDIAYVLAILFIVSKVLLIYAAFQVGRALFPQYVLAAVACAVLIATPSYLYSPSNLAQGNTEQTIFAVGFLFLSLAAFVKREWWKWGVYLGVAANMNFLYFMYGLSYYAVAGLAMEDKRRDYKRLALSLLTAVLISTPALYLLLRAARQPVEDPKAVWMVAELTYPPYFFPNTIGASWHVVFWLLIAVAWMLPLFRNLPISPVIARMLRAWASVAAGWYGLAWAAPFVFHSLLLMRLHPIRGIDLWYYAVSFIMAGMVASYIQSQVDSRRRIFLALALAGATLWQYLLTSSLEMIALTLGATLVGAEFIRQALKRLTALRGQTALTYYGAILLIGGALVSAHAMRSRLLTFGHPIFIRYPEVKVVAEWARQNTPSDAVFLIPVHGQWRYFRYLSRRSVFVHLKDGDSWPYAPWHAAEWLRRMEQLGLFEVTGLNRHDYAIGKWISIASSEWANPTANYYELVSKQIDDSRIQRLARTYRIDYWITFRETPTCYPVVYTHNAWKVVRVASAP